MFDITFAHQSFEKLVYGQDLFLKENLKIFVVDLHKLCLKNHGFVAHNPLRARAIVMSSAKATTLNFGVLPLVEIDQVTR